MKLCQPNRFILSPIALVLLLAPARAEESLPSPATEQSCVLPAKRMQRLELIFGLQSKSGPVTPRAWAKFLAKEVTPRFPDGLSVFDGYGQWRNERGKITKEASKLLLIWYLPGGVSEMKIEAIRSAYKTRFHQDSVLRSNEVSCVSF